MRNYRNEYFGKKTKNHVIWTYIHKDIREKKEERKIDGEEREFDKISKN